MSSWTIYWITRCDIIHDLALAVAITSLIIFLIMFIPFGISFDGTVKREDGFVTRKVVYKTWKWLAAACVFGTLCATFVPTTKQMAAIYIIPAIVNDERIQKESVEIYDLCKDYLKQELTLAKEKHVKHIVEPAEKK